MTRLTPKAIIFDLGSTLIEYEAVSWDELSKTCALAGRKLLIKEKHPVPDEAKFHEAFEAAKAPFREEASRSWIEWTVPQVAKKFFARLEIEADDGLTDRFFEAFYKPVDDLLYVYDDTVETLRTLRQTVPVLGLISNTVFPEEAHLRELKRFGIKPYLDFTLFSSTFGLRKPHPEIFAKAANLAGCAPKECLYVGDRYMEDIEGPAKIGMPAVLRMKEGREYPDEMPLATRRVDTLSELTEYLAF